MRQMLMKESMSEGYFEFLKERYSKINKSKYYERYIVFEIKDGSVILDVGCGLGFLLQKLNSMKNNLTTIGTDVDLSMLMHTRKLSPEQCLVRATASNLPFSDERIDAMFATDLVEHLEDCSAFLKDAQRVLRDDGRVIISTPDRFSIYLSESRNIIGQATFNILRVLGLAKIDPTHVREFTIKELSQLLAKNGFCIEKSNGYKRRLIPFHFMESIIVSCKKG